MQEEKKKRLMLAGGIVLGVTGAGITTAGAIVYSRNSHITEPTEYVILTFDGNGGTLDGSQMRVSKGSRFDSIAIPRVLSTPEFKHLDGWVDSKGQSITSSYVFNESQTIKAKWIDSGMVQLSFDSNGDTSIHFDGEISFAVQDGIEFGLVNKPTPSKENQGSTAYEFMGWKYKDSGVDVKDTDLIQGSTTVYPWFSERQDVEFINLTFSKWNELERDDIKITFNGIEDSFATRVDKKLVWGQINKPVPKKIETTVIEGETIITEYEFLGWRVENPSGELVEIDADHPFAGGETIYALFDEAPESLDSSYYTKDSNGNIQMIINGSESEGPIKRVTKNATTGEIEYLPPVARENFDQQVYLGKKVTSISPNFLRGCSNFNQPITIPDTVTYIGSGFLYGCSSFDQPIQMPSTVGSVGKCFLYSCKEMNSSITLSEGMYVIDDYFMTGCTAFNKNLHIPSRVINIGNSFMSHCDVFNNGTNDPSFAIPSGLVYLGSDFLSESLAFSRDLNLQQCSGLKAIPSSFLYGCTSYDGTITMPTSIETIGANFCAWTDNNPNLNNNFGSGAQYKLENLTSIGSGFLNKTTFNHDLYLTNTKLTTIGSSFLRNDGNFASELSIPNSVTSLDDSFLYGCSSFNSSNFALPTNLQYIGDEFMYLCSSFSYKLIIPSNVTHVGTAFIYYCTSMLQMEINCDASAFPDNDEKGFRQYINFIEDLITNYGIQISGDIDFNALQAKFGDRDYEGIGAYGRRLYQ